MNPEQYINKQHEEANNINEAVEEFFVEHPRSRKTDDEIADAIIKEEADLVPYRAIPEEHREWYQNMRSAGVRVLEDGFLEITRWDNTGKYADKPKLMKQKVDGLHSAIRMQDHILGGYCSTEESGNDEYSKLESIQEVIEYANQLLNEWKEADTPTRQDLQLKLADVVLQLEKCRNEFKVDTRDKAQAVMKLKDSRGRENPSALAARTVGALNSLSERMNQMQLIAPQIALRKEVLILEQRRVERALRKANSMLSGVLHHSVFTTKPNSKPEQRIKEHEVVILDKKLGQVIHELESIYIAPYHQVAEQAIFFIASIKKLFRSKEDLVNNLEIISETLADIQDILESKVQHFG